MKKTTLGEFLYKLWFTRDDDLDVLQVLFAIIVFVGLIIIWHISLTAGNNDAVKIEGLVTLRWLTGLLVITAVPKWLVPFVTPQTKSITPAPAVEPPISVEPPVA